MLSSTALVRFKDWEILHWHRIRHQAVGGLTGTGSPPAVRPPTSATFPLRAFFYPQAS